MSEKPQVGIVGYGYVGQAMEKFFAGHAEVWVADVREFVHDHKVDIGHINECCSVAFVCVPTPQSPDGQADISAVTEVVHQLETPLIVLKSTVPPGTTDALKRVTGKPLVFSPEYVGESAYFTPAPYDFHQEVARTPWFTFGGSPEDTKVCVHLFTPIAGPVKRYIQTTALEAELAKYMENSFYATKIAFCHEMAGVCEAFGADYTEVRELWLADPRINPMHTAVWDKEGPPFSGKCLPKDIAGIVYAAKLAGYDPELLAEVIATNGRLDGRRKEER